MRINLFLRRQLFRFQLQEIVKGEEKLCLLLCLVRLIGIALNYIAAKQGIVCRYLE